MREPDEEKPQPFNAELVSLLQAGLRAKARLLALFLGLAVLTFVWMAKDQGAPVWLIALIGFFGALLIALFIAIIWFWLFFLDHFRRVGARKPADPPPSDRP